jgi:hypothetical protein
MKTTKHFLQVLAQFFLEWEIFQIKVVEKNQNTSFVFNNIFENRTVYETMWKNIVERKQAAEDNMTHAHCMLDI